MKKIIPLLFLVASFVDLHGQSFPHCCFNDYYETFRDRGAEKVADGVHDVVVSIRKEGTCTCVLGKITVKDGKPVNDLVLEREDGTFEKFLYTPHSAYKTEIEFKNAINNGMSPTYYSANDEAINLFFIKSLKDKNAVLKKAPAIK